MTITCQIVIVIDGEAHLRNILFVQADGPVGGMPAVASEMLFVDNADPGNGIEYGAYLVSIYTYQAASAVSLVKIEPGEAVKGAQTSVVSRTKRLLLVPESKRGVISFGDKATV